MLRALATMLPISMRKNIGLLLTNCDLDTQNLETDSLPSEFSHLQSWTFQDPLPFCLSYRAQEKQGTQRQRATQKRKLEGIYDAAVDTANEIIEWIDQTPVQPTTGMLRMSDRIRDIEGHFEEIIRATVKYKALRQSLVNLRREGNETKRSRASSLSVRLKGVLMDIAFDIAWT
jgi:hypothetical protein